MDLNNKIMYKVKWTAEQKNRAIEILTDYFEQYGTGEAIYQSDEAQLEALELLSDIADDVLEINYEEEED